MKSRSSNIKIKMVPKEQKHSEGYIRNLPIVKNESVFNLTREKNVSVMKKDQIKSTNFHAINIYCEADNSKRYTGILYSFFY